MLDTIVAKAAQLFGDRGRRDLRVQTRLTQKFRLRATYGMSAELIDVSQPSTTLGLVRGTSRTRDAAARAVQVPDLAAEPPTPMRDSLLRRLPRAPVVPLLTRGRIVGALVVRRKAPGEFPKSTIELLQTFAAQSVLAIQNARLFSEIEEKSRAARRSQASTSRSSSPT